MVYKLTEIKEQYDEISAEIGKIKNETIRLEMETELSNIYSNYEMLNKMKEDYIEKQRTTPKEQEEID